MGRSGRNFMIIVSGPIDSERANTSTPSADADPLPAVVWLHEQGVADLLGNRGQVERLVVLGRGVLKARVVRRVLVRYEHRRRPLETEGDHRAVGRVLSHC